MKTTSKKLIMSLAIASSMLMAATTLAKGGNSGGRSFTSHVNSGSNNSSNSSNKFSGNTFKVSNQSTSAGSFKTGKLNSNVLSGIKTTNTSKNSGVVSAGSPSSHHKLDNIKISGINTSKNNVKSNALKSLSNSSSKKCGDHDFKKWCGNYCYPWYFGCYSNYGCYNYCYPSCCYLNYPTYTCEYVTPIIVSTAQPGRMQVMLGTVIMLNGQSFGAQPGGVRLRFNGMALPIQVIEWTPNAVKVQLPAIELPRITAADIEVVRPDGSLASTTPVELTVPQQVALNR